MNNVEQTIISQYGNSSTIGSLIQGMNQNIDPSADIDNFYNYVFNIDTAENFGLDIWGRIIGVSREVLTNPVTFLDDTAYRALLLLKALSSYASAPSINQLLLNWLGAGTRAYVTDRGGMQLVFQVESLLQPYQIEIIKNSGIFLRPAGVGATLVSTTYPVFGFREGGTRCFTGFNQAPFISPEAFSAIN